MQVRLNRRMPLPIETLGQRVHLARTRRGLTQTALAKAADMKQPDISKIELGLIQQTLGIARLAAALLVPVGWLEKGQGKEPDWDDLGGTQTTQSPAPTGVAHSLILKNAETVPSIPWEQLEMSEDQNGALPPTFIVVAQDDAMAPRARAGHEFLFRRGIKARPGAGVLVKDLATEMVHFREYRERPDGSWEAKASNDSYWSFNSVDHRLEILAVLRGTLRGWEEL